VTYPGVLSARGKEVKLYIGAEAAWRPDRTRGRGYWETGSEPLHTSYRVPKAVLTPAAGYVAEPRPPEHFLETSCDPLRRPHYASALYPVRLSVR